MTSAAVMRKTRNTVHSKVVTGASSPVDRTGRLTTPGQTTLGSLLRWSFPDGQVAWADGDDAAHVEGQLGAPVGDIDTPPAAVGAPAPAADKPEGRRRRRS